jgi:hypothetical protein
MVRRVFTATAVLLVIFFGSSEADLALPEAPGDGWTKAGKELRFTGQRLYDHINGGAELYHELGFERLRVQSYQKGEEEITLEIYEMETPESALGIYLQQSAGSTPVEGVDARNTGSKYQLSVVKGDVFFQVNSFSGAEEFLPTMASLAQQVVVALPDEETGDTWRLLPKEGLIAGSERLIRGQFGLQPIFTFGQGDILQLGGRVFGVVGDYRIDGETTFTRIVVEYPSEELAEKAYAHLLANLDEYLQVVEKGKGRLVFKDHKDRFGLVACDGSGMELLVRLPELPSDGH